MVASLTRYLAAILILGFGTQAFAAPEGTRIKLDQNQMQQLVATIAKDLIDPKSTRFRGIRAASVADKGIYVCGEINSKNRSGGDSGFMLFVARFRQQASNWDYALATGDTSLKTIAQICEKYGLKPLGY